jgi:hypothetical protein
VGRVTGVLAVTLVALLLMPTWALAKGPFQAVVEGPGIAPTPLRPRDSTTIGPALATMVEASGFFPQVGGGSSEALFPDRPRWDLGARYSVTYFIGGSDREGRIIEYLFPFADKGPVTYMPPGQPLWGTERTAGGWYLAGPRLKQLLTEIGLPKKTPTGSIGATSPHRTTADQESDESRIPGLFPTGALWVAGLLVGAGSLLALWRLQFRSASRASGRS